MINERRKFSRIPIPPDQATTTLLFGRRQFTVRLLDASPFGFAIECPVSLVASCGALLRIHTTEGWLEVRVVRLQANGESVRLGVQRVRYLGEQIDAGGSQRFVLALVLVGALATGVAAGAFLCPDLWHNMTQAIARSMR